MRVSLIITTYNSPAALFLVLQSVERQSTLPVDVVVADDGSNNETKKLIKKFQSTTSLKIVHSWQKDKGFRASKSRNKAIAQSGTDYLILIDGDVILHPKFIQDHIKNAEIGCFIQGTRVLLSKHATEKTYNKESVIFSCFSNGIKNRKNAIHSDFLSKFFLKKKKYLSRIKTCNMSFHRDDFINVNGFNNDFEGWGREDSEFAARLINSGISLKSVRFNAIQFHLWHAENTRAMLRKNDLLLKSTIKGNSKWCNNGIDKYL